jgi:hypothetical protein
MVGHFLGLQRIHGIDLDTEGELLHDPIGLKHNVCKLGASYERLFHLMIWPYYFFHEGALWVGWDSWIQRKGDVLTLYTFFIVNQESYC